jgi:hypothetical protein
LSQSRAISGLFEEARGFDQGGAAGDVVSALALLPVTGGT